MLLQFVQDNSVQRESEKGGYSMNRSGLRLGPARSGLLLSSLKKVLLLLVLFVVGVLIGQATLSSSSDDVVAALRRQHVDKVFTNDDGGNMPPQQVVVTTVADKSQSTISSGSRGVITAAPKTAAPNKKTSSKGEEPIRVLRDRIKDIAGDADDDEWPLHTLNNGREDFERFDLNSGTSVRCISRGMQQKCIFKNLVVHRNTFAVYHPLRQRRHSGNKKNSNSNSSLLLFPSLEPLASASFPNPIYPPDGQREPLIQNHKYRGHRIKILNEPHNEQQQHQDGDKDSIAPMVCSRVVTRPVVFLFRMSGHSTYHLWENNLGPFYATLLDPFDLSTETEQRALQQALLNESKLLVSFVDRKPREGPKAPKLLDQLLRAFTDTPLLNASRLSLPTCISTAVVGISSNRFPHRALVREIQKRLLGVPPSTTPHPPEKPNMIYISRNHPSVTRGRKMINEADVYPQFNKTMFDLVGKPVVKVFMEDMTFTEQIALASRTNIMFSPHGGGVANCIWMPPGSVTVEFVAPVGKTLPGMYHSMCGNSGVQHIHFLADPDPRDAAIRDNPRLFSNLIMPLDRLLDHAKKALRLYDAARAKQLR